MTFYPIFVRLRDRPCVVIGGGEVAERKALGLRRAGAGVTVISPELTGELQRLALAGEIRHQPRGYRPGDLAGAFLAYAATDDEAVNGEIAAEAESQGVLLNVVDRPALCDFIVPAVLERGDLVIAACTGGASPMMARRIREALGGQFGPEYGDALDILRTLRRRLADEGRTLDERKRIFAALLDSPLLDLLRGRDREGVNRLLAETLGGEYRWESQS